MFLKKFFMNEYQCYARNSCFLRLYVYFRESNFKKYKVLFYGKWYGSQFLKEILDWSFSGIIGNFNFMMPIGFNWHLLWLKIHELIKWGWFWRSSTLLVYFEQHIMILLLQSPQITFCFFVGMGDKWDKYLLSFILMESILAELMCLRKFLMQWKMSAKMKLIGWLSLKVHT